MTALPHPIMTLHLVALLMLFALSGCAGLQPQTLAKNSYRDQAPEKVAAIEKIIQRHLALQGAISHYDRPVLAKNHAVPIRNPFTRLPERTSLELTRSGIDLATMSGYPALYIGGQLTGANAIKLINTDPRTILVIGSNTITHQDIFSRGPIVVAGNTRLMSAIYSADLLWFGEQASTPSDPVIGLPIVTSNKPEHSFGISPYSAEEEAAAMLKLDNKTSASR